MGSRRISIKNMKCISVTCSNLEFCVSSVQTCIVKQIIYKMRTSQTQFELMVDFMERYGDLSKPTPGPRGKMANARLWDNLKDILNQDTTGETKNTEKWRKTWSDFKNNTKRKAARVNAGVRETGGGPASTLQLTPLESRVMQIIGMQAAIGIPYVPEIGLEDHQEQQVQQNPSLDAPEPSVSLLLGYNTPLAGSTENSMLPDADSVPPAEIIPDNFEPQPGPSGLQRPLSTTPREERLRSPRRRRGLRRQLMSSPLRNRRRLVPSHADRVASQFLHSDEEWRQFRIEQDRENRRLRQRELDIQERWQEIALKFVDIAEKFLNK